MRIALGLAAIGLLAACGSERSGDFETEEGEGTYTVDSSTGDAEIRFSGKDGEEAVVNVGRGGDEDLPAGFSVYPGAEVMSNSTMSQAGGTGAMVIMQSSDSPDEMVDHYRAQAEAVGISIELEATTSGSKMIGGQSAGGANFSFTATPGADGTTGNLIVSQGLQ